MNANMNLAVSPAGEVVVIGTEAMNHIRFEPIVNGIFVRVMAARFAPATAGADTIVDLNPHLDYSVPTVGQPTRNQSIGDPRGLDWNAGRLVRTPIRDRQSSEPPRLRRSTVRRTGWKLRGLQRKNWYLHRGGKVVTSQRADYRNNPP